MAVFILLTRLDPAAVRSPQALQAVERHSMDQVRTACPNVRWISSLALLGPYDYLDVFEAQDADTAARVSALIRIHGHATTEVWTGIEWPRFKTLLAGLPPASPG